MIPFYDHLFPLLYSFYSIDWLQYDSVGIMRCYSHRHFFQHDYVAYFIAYFCFCTDWLWHDSVGIMRYDNHMYLQYNCIDLIIIINHITLHIFDIYFYTKLCTSQTSVQKGASINTSKSFMHLVQVFHDDLIYLTSYHDHIISSSHFDMSVRLIFGNFILVTTFSTLSLTNPSISGLVDWLGLKP